MNPWKFTKRPFLITCAAAAILIPLGAVLIMGGASAKVSGAHSALIHWLNKLETSSVQRVIAFKHLSLANISRLKVSNGEYSVFIGTSPDEEIKVDFRDSNLTVGDDSQLELEQVGDSLTVKLVKAENSRFQLSSLFKSVATLHTQRTKTTDSSGTRRIVSSLIRPLNPETLIGDNARLRIWIPESYKGTLELSAKEGRVVVGQSKAVALTVTTEAGNVYLFDCDLDIDTNVTTQSGSITVQGQTWNGFAYELSSRTGRVETFLAGELFRSLDGGGVLRSEIAARGKLRAKSDTGSIIVSIDDPGVESSPH